MKSWVKSDALRASSGKRTVAALVLWPILALQGCSDKEEQNTAATPTTASSLRTNGNALALAGYTKTQVPIAWRYFEGTNLGQGDDTVTTVTSPFPIPFAAGAGRTSVRIGMNGFVSFDSSPSWTNNPLPYASATTLLPIHWDDLYPGPTSADNVYWGVLGNEPNRELVVEWRNVHNRATRTGTDTLRMQMVLFESSPDILFNYMDVVVGNSTYDNGASATVGVQIDATTAEQHSHNEPALEDNTAYLWEWPATGTPPVVDSITVTPSTAVEGDDLDVAATFSDPDGDGDSPWKVQIDTNYEGFFSPENTIDTPTQGTVSTTLPVRASGDVTVAVRVQDVNYARSAVMTHTITVADVPPTAFPIVSQATEINELQTVNFTSGFSDPGIDAPWIVEWDFDYDGVTFDVEASTTAVVPGDHGIDYAFPGDGTFTVAVRVTDKDGVVSNIETLAVEVLDLKPSITGIAGATELYEGSDLSLSAEFYNPGDDSSPWRIQWDLDYDGVTFNVHEEEEVATDGYFEFNRFARDAGNLTYAVRIVDNDGSESEIRTIQMNIIEADPLLSPLNATALSGGGSEPTVMSFDLSAGSGAADPTADPITAFLWDFDGDGTFDYASTAPYALYTYRDNAPGGGAYTARVRVMDEDTYSEEEISVTITNVVPTLMAPASVNVEEGSLLALRVNAHDPGADALTFSLTGAPEGLSITPDGLIVWTPALHQTSGTGRVHSVTVTVTDDDGDSDSQTIDIMAWWKDRDNDGMADTWEQANGLDTTMDDSAGDHDGDGVSNLAEFLSANGGPRVPDAVVADGPLSGDQVDSAQLVLTTRNVVNAGDLADRKYQFQLFADAALTHKVRDVTVDQAATGTTTSATLTDGVGDPTLEDLEDDKTYAWRVRATDGTMHGPWSMPQHVKFNPTNDAPGTVLTSHPMSGTQVSTNRPMLVVDNAMDVDDMDLTYTFELAEDAGMTQGLVTSNAIAADARGNTAWVVPNALDQLKTYYWRATATDPHGATSMSEVASFTVFIGTQPGPPNREPGAPALAEPSSNGMVNTLTPTLVADATTDADGDTLMYMFQLDTSPMFTSNARQESTALAAEEDGKVRWQPEALTENAHYYWRIRAMDATSASDWSVGMFMVNAENDAPSAPVALNPSDAMIFTKTPTLIVQNGMDPEGDAVTYSFEVRKGTEVVASGENVAAGASGQTSFKVTHDLEAGEEYVWVARAKDAAGAVSAASAGASFQVYKAPVVTQPPAEDDGGCSAGAGTMGGILPLLAMAFGLLRRRRS